MQKTSTNSEDLWTKLPEEQSLKANNQCAMEILVAIACWGND